LDNYLLAAFQWREGLYSAYSQTSILSGLCIPSGRGGRQLNPSTFGGLVSSCIVFFVNANGTYFLQLCPPQYGRRVPGLLCPQLLKWCGGTAAGVEI